MSAVVRYSNVTVLLHWVSALAIFGTLAMGFVMTNLPPTSPTTFSLYQWHKSVGVTILALTALRVFWRFVRHPPALPTSMPAWEQKAAHLGHFGLYVLLFGLTLTGWLVVSTSPFNIPTVLYGSVNWPHLPIEWMGEKSAVNKAMVAAHRWTVWVLIALLLGHIAAVLRHHLILRDGVLKRMLPCLCIAVILAGTLPVQAAQWKVEHSSSRLGFGGIQQGEPFIGEFARWDALIDFDPADPTTGKATITVDMSSAATGDVQKDQALPQTDWFDVQVFSKAVFQANSFKAKGDNAYDAIGTLTIRNVTKEVVLPFTLEISGKEARARGRLNLIRTDYGVGQGEYWSSGDWVALEVGVEFDIIASHSP